MEIFLTITSLVSKLAQLAIDAYGAAQAKDAERHAKAVQGMVDALDEVRAKLTDMDSHHAIQLQAALDVVATRFPPTL